MRTSSRIAIDYLYITAGSAATALAITLFLNPAQLAPGGVSGISTILFHTLGWDLGTSMMAMTIPSEPATKDPTRSFFSRGIFSRPIPEGVTGLKERNVIGSHGCILLFAFKGGTAPGSTEEAIFDFGLARRAFLHGYPSPANRTHYAREKKKAGPRPASWLLSLTS